MVLAFAVPLYGRLVATFPRIKLINVVTVFFVICPPAFYVLAQFGVPLGMIYFVWIGVFSLMIVAQFWSFANDVYYEGGRRAPAGDRRPRRVARRGRRRPRRRPAHRALRRDAVDAARRRGARRFSCCSPTTSIAADRARRPPPRQPASEGEGRPVTERLRDGVQDALSAADGVDDPDDQLDQRDRRVHPRQHRQGARRGDDRRRHGRWTERGPDHRRFLRQVFLAGERDWPHPPAVRRLAHHQAPRGRRGP